MGAVAVMITTGMQLVGVLAPVAIDLAQKIKHALQNDPNSDFTVELKTLEDQIVNDSDATLKMIADWKASKGLV